VEEKEGSEQSRSRYITQGLSQPFLLLEPKSILSFLQMEVLLRELHSHFQGFLVQFYAMQS